MYQSLPKSYKSIYPFTLGTTSFIYPDTWSRNAERLGPFIDTLELLLFESRTPGSLPSADEIRTLRHLAQTLKFSFNIHLPTDVFPGDPDRGTRHKAVENLARVIRLTAPLQPTTLTLHLEFGRNPTDKQGVDRWQQRLRGSLEALLATGVPPRLLSIETLMYPYDWVMPLVEEYDLRICMDIGHLVLQGIDPEAFFSRHESRISILHLHGVRDQRDHQELGWSDRRIQESVLKILHSFSGTVSLEVFSFDKLHKSLNFLEQQWPVERRNGN